MIRVAIIDDHYVVRIGLKTIIEMDDELELVGEAASGAGAAAFVLTTKPDVLLLDIRMPGRDGIETLESILSVKPSQKVVMLTTSDADDEVYRALNKGARGYLLKDRDSDAICKAIKTVYNGGKFIPEAVKEIYRRRQMMTDLTPREREVLELVAGGLSNDDVAKRLGISYESVKVHMKHLLFKFDVHDRTELVSLAIRGGFVKDVPAK